MTKTTKVQIRARAFNGKLETIKALVAEDGIRVWDSVAGYYTTCHSLSARDQGRIKAAARRA